MNVQGYAAVYMRNYEVIFNSTFRRTMSGIMLHRYDAAQTPPTVLISQYVFQGNLMIRYAFLDLLAYVPVRIVIFECSFNHNTPLLEAGISKPNTSRSGAAL